MFRSVPYCHVRILWSHHNRTHQISQNHQQRNKYHLKQTLLDITAFEAISRYWLQCTMTIKMLVQQQETIQFAIQVTVRRIHINYWIHSARKKKTKTHAHWNHPWKMNQLTQCASSTHTHKRIDLIWNDWNNRVKRTVKNIASLNKCDHHLCTNIILHTNCITIVTLAAFFYLPMFCM